MLIGPATCAYGTKYWCQSQAHLDECAAEYGVDGVDASVLNLACGRCSLVNCNYPGTQICNAGVCVANTPA